MKKTSLKHTIGACALLLCALGAHAAERVATSSNASTPQPKTDIACEMAKSNASMDAQYDEVLAGTGTCDCKPVMSGHYYVCSVQASYTKRKQGSSTGSGAAIGK
jgi:hypothetical protein